jgi:hypothetical protein
MESSAATASNDRAGASEPVPAAARQSLRPLIIAICTAVVFLYVTIGVGIYLLVTLV